MIAGLFVGGVIGFVCGIFCEQQRRRELARRRTIRPPQARPPEFRRRCWPN